MQTLKTLYQQFKVWTRQAASVFMIVTICCGPSFGGTQKEILINLPQEQRDLIDRAEKLQENNDLKGAIKLIRPLADSGKAHGYVLATLGRFYELDQDDASAEFWYGRAVNVTKDDPTRLPIILRVKHSSILLRLKRYNEAISELEIASKHGEYHPEDPEIYSMLTALYEAAGAVGEAYSSCLTVIALAPYDEQSWDTIKRLRLKLNTSQSDISIRNNLLTLTDLDQFKSIIALGFPDRWTLIDLGEGVTAYVRFSQLLSKRSLTIAASMYRNVAIRAAFRLAVESTAAKQYSESIRAFSIANEVSQIQTFSPSFQRLAWSHLIINHANLGQFLHAISAAEHLFSLPATKEEAEEDRKLLRQLTRLIFESVSFDPLSKSVRKDADFDDFVGPIIEVKSEDPNFVNRDSIIKLLRYRPQGSKKIELRYFMPYGAVSSEEDYTNILTKVIVYERDRKNRFEALLRKRLQEMNFELPVKAFLSEILSSQDTGNKSQVLHVFGLPLVEIEEAMQKAPPDSISSATTEAYIVGKRAASLFAKDREIIKEPEDGGPIKNRVP